MSDSEHADTSTRNKRSVIDRLDAIGWGLFLVWMGVAFLADVGWDVGIFGVGLIALGGQAARRYLGVPVERFGLAIGIVFLVWGAWDLLKLRFGEARFPGGLLPVLCIILGSVVIVAALIRKPRMR